MPRGWIALALTAVLTVSARAGGGPQNVLVVINDQSIESQEVGHYYRQQRGIPERNLVHVSVPPASAAAVYHNMTNTAFQTSIVQRIQQHITTYGLSNQIDFIVLCQDLPTRVNDNEGATAVLFYGCKNAPRIVSTCTMPTNTASGYYKAERAFYRPDPYGGTNYCLSTLLVGKHLAMVLSNITRSVESDGTAPAGCFYLVEGSDPARQVRYTLFDNFDFSARFLPDFPARAYPGFGPINGKTNVMGCLIGSAWVNDFWAGYTNQYLRGSIADHLTSYGGRLPDALGQSPAWDWLASGVGGSYGTVNEPCAYTEKFPDPLVYYWYARGFSLAEGYWMSVANPYQGVFLGDPLMAPYARPPAIMITNLISHQVVSGSVPVNLLAGTNTAGHPAARVDVYVNDLWTATATNVEPAAGNEVTVTIAGQPVAYQVASGDTLYTVVTNLAGRINASNLAARATACGDRLELVYTNYGAFGTGLAYSAATATGAASELTLFAEALGSNLLESAYVAREFITLQAYGGKANTGDTVTCIITLTNGVATTNHIIAAQDETPKQVMTRLMNAINNDALLSGTNGARANPHTYVAVASLPLEARRPGPEGYLLQVNYTITPTIPGSGLYPDDSFTDHFNDNLGDLTARGAVLFRRGREPLEASWSWDTTAWPNGPHILRAVARTGTGPETQGQSLLPVVVSNSPFACWLAEPTNGANVVLGSNLLLQASVTNEAAMVTQLVFYVEGKPHTILTNAPFVAAVGTLSYGVGQVSVWAQAWDGTGNSARSAPGWITIERSPSLDTDSDGLADSWEQQYFGGLYVYSATNDPDSDGMPNDYEFAHDLDPSVNDAGADGDGDGANNWQEYVALTDPNDSNSVFAVEIVSLSNELPRLSFFTDTGRVYEIRYLTGDLTNMASWLVASNSPFQGIGGVTNWLDSAAQSEPPPESETVTQRQYRIRVARPE